MNIVGLEESKKRSKQTGLSVDAQNVIDNTYAQNMAKDKEYFDDRVTQTNEIYGDNGALKDAIDEQNNTRQSYIDALSGIVEQADRDRKKMEYEDIQYSKRARAKQLINAFGDGFSALSNLIGTIKGAAPVEQSLATTKFKAQYDDAKAKRDKMYQDNKERIRKINEEKGKAELERGLTYANAVANWKANRQAALDNIEAQRRQAEAARVQQRGAEEAKALGVQQFDENKKQQKEQFAETKKFQREQLAQQKQLKEQQMAIKRYTDYNKNRKMVQMTYVDPDTGEKKPIEIAEHRLDKIIIKHKDNILKDKIAAQDEIIKAADERLNMSKRDKRKNDVDESVEKQKKREALLEKDRLKNIKPNDYVKEILQYAESNPEVLSDIIRAAEEDAGTKKAIIEQLESAGIDLDALGFNDDNAPEPTPQSSNSNEEISSWDEGNDDGIESWKM